MAKVTEIDDDRGADDAEPEVEATWKDELLLMLMQLEPAAFERLCQRMLRESGFVEVEVTGRTGDGGVDGKGIMRLNPFLSMRVVFQCKRYQGTVSSAAVRDFRGAMVGRADKGLLITTGTFSRDAKAEATRDGAPPIDLVDGDDLAEQLKTLRLGVSTKLVEEVEVEAEWFSEM